MSELLPCRKCGELDFDMWHGQGTQADLSCNNCGQEEGVQVSDLLTYEERCGGDFDFNMDTLSYPDEAVERAKEELINQWNTRPTRAITNDMVERADDALKNAFEVAGKSKDEYEDLAKRLTMASMVKRGSKAISFKWQEKAEQWGHKVGAYIDSEELAKAALIAALEGEDGDN